MAACALKRIRDDGVAAPTAACPLRRMNAEIWDSGVEADECAAEGELQGASKRQRLWVPETPVATYLQ